MLLAAFLILAGVALLYFGGELLVDNSIRLARAFNVSTMVIGLTVVAFATSCPELAATLTATIRDAPDIAVGNIFGSNVANLGLILGLSALVMPLAVERSFLRREVAFMVLATIVVYPLMIEGWTLARWEGAILLAMLVGYVWRLLSGKGSDETPPIPVDEIERAPRPPWLSMLGVAVGIGLLVGGAQALIEGATTVARAVGISERVIGLTLVAVGTSLPELAASVVAATKKEGSLVLGNLVGSNIFNLLCILGLTAMVKPIPVSREAMGLDFWVMLGISVGVLVLLGTHRRLERWEGALLLAFYVGYMGYLFF